MQKPDNPQSRSKLASRKEIEAASFDIDFRQLFESGPSLYLILAPTPNFTIIAVSNAYLQATRTERDKIIGRGLFEVFPDNPADPTATGTTNLRASLNRVLANRSADTMAVQKYDIPLPESEGGGFEEKYWSPINCPVFDSQGKIIHIIHRAEDITEYIQDKQMRMKQSQFNQVLEARTLEMEAEIYRKNQELQRSRQFEAEFRSLANSIPQLAWMANSKGEIYWYNQRWYDYTGTHLKEMKGWGWKKVHHPDHVDRVVEKIQQAWISGDPWEDLFPLRSKNGEWRWFLSRATPIKDNRQRVLRWFGTNTDITEHRETEEALRKSRAHLELEKTKIEQSERLLDQLFNESPSFMALHSLPDYRIEKANDQYLKAAYRSRKEVIGKTIREVLPELESQGFIKLLDEVVRTGQPYIGNEVPATLIQPDGQSTTAYSDFVYQPMSKPSGEIFGVAVQGYVVTEKVLSRRAVEQAKKAIENERENFRNLFRQTPEVVCILAGSEHVFEFVNESHIKTLGFNATGMSVRQAQPESIEVHGILDEVYRTGKTAALYEIPITVVDRIRYFNLTYAARRDEQGQINGILVLGEEITKQKQSELALKEALRIRDEFLSIASHELKTPLTPLKLQVQGLLKTAKQGKLSQTSPEKVFKMAEVCEKQISRLTALIEDLLDVSRISAGKMTLNPEQINLVELVKDVVDRYCPPTSETPCDFECPMTAIWGECDRLRVEQVLINLISNAIKYAPGRRIRILLSQHQDSTLLQVQDQGVGISAEFASKIFERFERIPSPTNVTGLGLGLFISKQIIEAHGGSISVESTLGQGATFTVRLPLRFTKPLEKVA